MEIFIRFIPQVYENALFRIKTMEITDSRINLTSEILNGIKVLKMYGWEKAFEEIIKRYRM
jgi:ATP-binding cassette subfamily C (CFTR/MRP) protein 4